MEATFVKSEGEYLEAVIVVNNQELHVMDEFGGERLKPGASIEVRISAGLLDYEESWESIFSGNPEKEKSLTQISGWRYRAKGQVTKIGEETLVNVGLQAFEAPFSTHDKAVLGEYVSFTISRLDACSS
jgi:hypothetical protein